MTSKQIAENNENEFQRAFNRWTNSKHTDKKAYDTMFICMEFAAENLIKSKLKVFRDDVDGLATDLALLLMERDIKAKHIRPQKLSSYLYLPLLGILHSHQLQFEEQFGSYEVLAENRDFEEEARPIHKESLFTLEADEYCNEERRISVNEIKIKKGVVEDPDYIMQLCGWEYHD